MRGLLLGLAAVVLVGCVGEDGPVFVRPSSSSSTGATSSSSSSSSSSGDSGGTGGTGGASSSSSSGEGPGGGGASSSSSSSGGMACAESADCPGFPGPPCAQVACVAGSCAVVAPPLGTPTTDATPGDCHSTACDGQGGTVELVDVSDIPDDSNDCTVDKCDGQGKAWNTPLPAGASCSSNGGTKCDGAGACVECFTDADCGGPPTPCASFFDQFACLKQQGCMWDSFNWFCSGTPTGGTCTGGACM